jgi:hypothetical protein
MLSVLLPPAANSHAASIQSQSKYSYDVWTVYIVRDNSEVAWCVVVIGYGTFNDDGLRIIFYEPYLSVYHRWECEPTGPT